MDVVFLITLVPNKECGEADSYHMDDNRISQPRLWRTQACGSVYKPLDYSSRIKRSDWLKLMSPSCSQLRTAVFREVGW